MRQRVYVLEFTQPELRASFFVALDRLALSAGRGGRCHVAEVVEEECDVACEMEMLRVNCGKDGKVRCALRWRAAVAGVRMVA